LEGLQRGAAENDDVDGLKHLALKELFLKELVEEGVLRMERVEGKLNVADVLTKALLPGAFATCLQRLPSWNFGDLSVEEEEVNSLEIVVADASMQCSRVHRTIPDEEQTVRRSRPACLETALYTVGGVLAALQLESCRRSVCSFLCRRRPRKKKRRTVATQSQCTYTSVRGNAQGKFLPSGKASEGAFVQ
jgi:hypothetical protein